METKEKERGTGEFHSIQKLNYRHEAIISFMISHPDMKQGEIASALGISEAWLSTIKRSDMFRREYKRRMNIHHEELDTQVREKLYKVGIKALDRVDEALEEVDEDGHYVVDPRFALDAKDKALARLGFGTSKGATAGNTDIPNSHATGEDLEAARKLLDAASQYNSTIKEQNEERVINPQEGSDYGENCQEGGYVLGQEVEGESPESSDQEGADNSPPEILPEQGEVGEREDEGGEEV